MFANLRLARDLGWWAQVHPGTYWRVINEYGLQMSNTPMEIHTNQKVKEFSGYVLVFGLGLGLVIDLINWNLVEHLDIVEIDPDIIKLMTPFIDEYTSIYPERNITIFQGDALSADPLPSGICYNYIWFDIWPNICVDNLDEMKKLKNFAKDHIPNAKYIGCWSEQELRDKYICPECNEQIDYDCCCYRCDECNELEDECFCERCDCCDEIIDYCICDICDTCELPEYECECE